MEMQMANASAITITAIVILLSGLFSGSEIAFVQSSKVRMEIDGTRGGIIDKIIRFFSRHGDMFISTLLIVSQYPYSSILSSRTASTMTPPCLYAIP